MKVIWISISDFYVLFVAITFGYYSFGCLWIKDTPELPQLSSLGDQSIESMNMETMSQCVWVSHQVHCENF